MYSIIRVSIQPLSITLVFIRLFLRRIVLLTVYNNLALIKPNSSSSRSYSSCLFRRLLVRTRCSLYVLPYIASAFYVLLPSYEIRLLLRTSRLRFYVYLTPSYTTSPISTEPYLYSTPVSRAITYYTISRSLSRTGQIGIIATRLRRAALYDQTLGSPTIMPLTFKASLRLIDYYPILSILLELPTLGRHPSLRPVSLSVFVELCLDLVGRSYILSAAIVIRTYTESQVRIGLLASVIGLRLQARGVLIVIQPPNGDDQRGVFVVSSLGSTEGAFRTY